MTASPEQGRPGPATDPAQPASRPARFDPPGRWPLGVYCALLAGSFVAAAAAAAIYVSVQSDHDARRNATRDVRFAAGAAARVLGNEVATLRGTVERLAANPRAARALGTHQCTLLFAGVGALADGHLELLRPDGAVVCSSRRQSPGSRLSGYTGAGWLRRARLGPLFLAPVTDAATRKQAALGAAPIPGGGIIAAFAPLDPVGDRLASLLDGDHRIVMLVTSIDGRIVIARSGDSGRRVGTAVSGTPFAPLSSRLDRVGLDGKPRFYGEAVVPGPGWRVFAGEEESAVLAAGVGLRDRELAIILGGLALALVATLLAYRRVALPIGRLAAAVRSADPYDQHVPAVPVAGPAELATLASDINGLVASVGRELRERRQLEDQLHHVQKMDALGRVAAGVAHDFNNLLTVIAGFTSLILKSARDDEQLKAHAEEVGRAAERAAALIRQLSLFSRKEQFQPTVLDANELVGGMEAMLRRVLGANIELTTQLRAKPATVAGDPGRLEQVLMNLAVNARDAMSGGGSLTLTTQTTDFDSAAADAHGLEPRAYVLVTVADTGTGMDAHTQARLFEPFFTTKPPGEGTGLGLATCYGIVSRLGGRIAVSSEPGHGSVFSIYLPLAEAPAERAPELPPAQTGAAAGKTILLVEDDASLRALAKIVLEHAGYDVLEARFGEEAVWVADRHEGPIDLLLTDGVMPVMSGGEVAERLLELHPETRVVYMSGYDRRSLPGKPPPEEAFLAKPFTPETLLAKVHDTLE